MASHISHARHGQPGTASRQPCPARPRGQPASQAKTGLYPGLWNSELLRRTFSNRAAGRAEAVSYKEFFDKSPSVKPTIEGGRENGYLCWRPKCGPASYPWRFEYARDKDGRYWIIGVGC